MKKKILLAAIAAFCTLPLSAFALETGNSVSTNSLHPKIEIQGLLQREVEVFLKFPTSSYTKDMVPLRATYYEGDYGGVLTRSSTVIKVNYPDGSYWEAQYKGTIYKEM
ncbi:hypothetical protein MHI48_20330 [Paenibacillus sp. FSL H7-0942]|uniref:hypothetical protein n=1 Tax=Paenibacillus TaxID=44249 RepID=UPI00035F10BA|nr:MULTISPECIES: hypothetical protein [Paenibacillus]OMF06296.1 hypothetical protein BK129_11480 [Paenibacillus amylolyticus]